MGQFGMSQDKVIRPLACRVLYGLLGFLGVGACAGGGLLMISPAGDALNMPSTILNGTFSGSYLIPGFILFAVLGLYPIVVLFGLIKKPVWRLAEWFNVYPDKHWSYAHTLYIGFALLIWLSVQIYIIQAMAWIHIIYYIVGFAIQIVTLLPSVQVFYKK